MNTETVKDIIEVVKITEKTNDKLCHENNIIVENKEINCNINNSAYYIEVENTDTVIFDEIYNKYNVYKEDMQKGSIYLFTLYYSIFAEGLFIRYKI